MTQTGSSATEQMRMGGGREGEGECGRWEHRSKRSVDERREEMASDFSCVVYFSRLWLDIMRLQTTQLS